MRVLFVIRHRGYVRLFDAMLRELAARGHHVHLAFERDDQRATSSSEHALADRLCAELPSLTQGPAPVRADGWVTLAAGLRRAIDYLRYLAPVYADAPKLRARGARDAPGIVVALTRLPGMSSPAVVRALDRVLRATERAVPRSAQVDAYLREHAPDLLVVTPLIAEPSQEDFVRSARALGIRSALCVASWDNLTNKGLIRDLPERIYVWNSDQEREAVELHDIPPERLEATGAHSFDQWFAWRPSTEEREFRERVGLPAGGPLLLYLCSSNFIAPNEPRFVAGWVRRLREHPDPRLREAAILVRPHPKSGPKQWKGIDVAGEPGVAVWPPTGATTGDAEAKSEFFDSMYHCDAVVGLNTSAIIESAIVGRPAYTVLAPEYAGTQQGTLHFHYLVAENGGPLQVAESFDEHLAQLAAALAPGGAPARADEFLRRFLRPRGLERPATPELVDALEAQAARPAPAPAVPDHPAWLPAALRVPATVAVVAERRSGAWRGWRRRAERRLRRARRTARTGSRRLQRLRRRYGGPLARPRTRR